VVDLLRLLRAAVVDEVEEAIGAAAPAEMGYPRSGQLIMIVMMFTGFLT
jgi:hypothetical protein